MKSLSSNFAENQLKKFGWKEGDGIGKNSQGMIAPIKVSLKFDTSGVGFNLSEQYTTNWWENLYNTTAKEIEGAEKRIGQVEKKSNNSLNRKSYFYSRFHKEGTLVNGIEIKEKKTIKIEEKNIEEKKDKEGKEKNDKRVTDEDLYKLCEGRTAHKGARHGIKMNGKLARLEEQERLLSEKLLNKIEDKKIRDKKRKVDESDEKLRQIDCEIDLAKVKKKKKSKKSYHDE